MCSRLVLFALPVMMVAAPVSAQHIMFVSGTGDDVSVSNFENGSLGNTSNDAEILELAEKIADPDVQAGVSSAIERITSGMLQMPVGQFVAAIETAMPGTVAKRIPRDATVADLAGRDTDDLPARLGDGGRQMMGMASGFARALAVMMPEFERMGREIEESFRTAKSQARQR